jgi:hypothetical protein
MPYAGADPFDPAASHSGITLWIDYLPRIRGTSPCTLRHCRAVYGQIVSHIECEVKSSRGIFIFINCPVERGNMKIAF